MLEMIEACRAAKKAYDVQYRKLYKPQYNIRYQAKADRLYNEWMALEKALIRAMYK